MPARVVLRTVLDAIPSLLLIVIIIGGILGGVFTATEASAVAYATVLAFLYKGITLKDLPRIILDSARMPRIIAPPVGSILFTGCKVGRVDIESVVKELLPYFAAILVTLLLVTYIPAISMALPTAAGLIK